MSGEAGKMNNLVKKLTKAAKELNGEEKITAANLVVAVPYLMKLASNAKGLSGTSKRDAVVKAIQNSIDESDMAGPFEGIVLSIVPSMCDVLIDVEKGKLKINKRACPLNWNCLKPKKTTTN